MIKSFGCSRYIYNYFLGKNKNYIKVQIIFKFNETMTIILFIKNILNEELFGDFK
ncbi:MAG: helix-turn-helix domain-containing protein [Bacilli bacterium]|nr:helix-turn-helix domain-containing protein [Bacilli bacterium]